MNSFRSVCYGEVKWKNIRIRCFERTVKIFRSRMEELSEFGGAFFIFFFSRTTGRAGARVGVGGAGAATMAMIYVFFFFYYIRGMGVRQRPIAAIWVSECPY